VTPWKFERRQEIFRMEISESILEPEEEEPDAEDILQNKL
jgi:hypothetical protein